MKELSIKEKAKAYDELKVKAQQIHNKENDVLILHTIEELFPELKESEDEKIRKSIARLIKAFYDCNFPTPEGLERNDLLAWLEKQGEHIENYDEAEKEKNDFVDGKFIECRKSFNEFKEDNSYWLEYVGNDTYIGRSDNILNKKFHITPRQLYHLFTQQHCPKEDNANEEANAPTEYGKYVDECLNEASKHFFSEGEDTYSVADLFYAGVRCGKSWLDKQGEQKPTDKVEPKFKVGDWVVTSYGKVNQIVSVNKDGDGYTLDDDVYFSGSWCDMYHLWTIQDAKDGDVLVDRYGNIGIFEKTFGSDWHSYCYLGCNGDFMYDDIGGSHDSIDTYPATKEQRDQLEKAMTDAGYTFDFEKKELRKIENKNLLLSDFFKAEYERGKADALKHVEWSEEDKQYFNFLEKLLVYLQSKSTENEIKRGTNSNSEYYYEVIQWLKSLRPQNTWKPSDEQIEALEHFVRSIGESGYASPYENNTKLLYSLLEQLKKLKG